ncbi:hypothetical protein [Streptomyces sp. NPDC037389]|uniref:hypothetical protein n=1 Tax=Streptomyces sp. NPDC037389 TaxID=3155369 RepID=UPI0033DBD925
MTTHDFAAVRRQALTTAYRQLQQARAELEETAPPEAVSRYTQALLGAVGEFQSPLWGRAPGPIDPNGYIHPAELLPDGGVDTSISPEARTQNAYDTDRGRHRTSQTRA